MIRFRDNPYFNDWTPPSPPELEKDVIPANDNVKQQEEAVLPDVAPGPLRGERQLLSDFWRGMIRQLTPKKVAPTGSFKQSLENTLPSWKLAHQIVTGTGRVEAEFLTGLINPKKITKIKSKFLQGLFGTDTLVPIPLQIRAVKERYGTLMSMIVFPAMKATEALGPFLFKGKVYYKGVEVSEATARALEVAGKSVKRIGGTGPFETLIESANVPIKVRGKSFKIPLGIKPLGRKIISRYFTKDVSPTIEYLGGLKKWKATLESSEKFAGGRTAKEVATAAELYARKQAVQEQAILAGEDISNLGKEEWSRRMANVSDEKIWEIYNRSGKKPEDFISETAKWWEASDLGRQIKAKDVVAFEGKTIGELEKEFGKDWVDLLIDKPKKIIAAKVLPKKAVANAVKFVEEKLKAVEAKTGSDKVRADFINQLAEENPAYVPFKPLLFKEYQQGGLDGLLNAVKNAEEMAKIKVKPGTESFNLSEKMKQNGYFPMEAPEQVKGLPYEISRRLAPKETIYPTLEGAPELPAKEMSPLGRLVSKAGLSPLGDYGKSFSERQRIFNENVANLGEYGSYLDTERFGILDKGRLYSALNKVARDKTEVGFLPKKVTLVDGLSVKDIASGLGVAEDVAKGIKAAIRKSRNIPIEISGFGEKVVNRIKAIPGFGDFYSDMLNLTYFGHFQGITSWAHAIRYNFKMTLLAAMKNAKVVPKIMPKIIAKPLRATFDLFERKFPKFFGGKGYRLPNMKRIIGENISKESADIMETYFYSRTSKSFDVVNEADLTGTKYFKEAGNWESHNWWLRKIGFEEKTVGTQLTLDFGKLHGLEGSQEEILSQIVKNPYLYRQARDMVEGLVHYKEGFLTSPLIRTLNIMFYPFRFQTKVASLTADFLVRQNPITQTMIMKGMMDMALWSQSKEGKKWINENRGWVNLASNVIPYIHLGEMIGATAEGHFGDIGQIGGIPFGFIQSILTQEGVIVNKWVSPRTRKEATQTIPRGFNREALALGTAGLMRHFFPFPIYTFSFPISSKFNLKQLHAGDVFPLVDKKLYEKIFDVDTSNYLRTRDYKPRPEHLFPNIPYPWNKVIQNLLHEEPE